MNKTFLSFFIINIIALTAIFAYFNSYSSCPHLINQTMFQELEVYEAKNGVSPEELRDVLQSGEERIGNEYIKRMKKLGILGDDSFVLDLGDRVLLISYYLHGKAPESTVSGNTIEIPGMPEYQNDLAKFFDENAKAQKLKPANSFWNSLYSN